jgi:alkylhydroperoxidase/carboxymuconolactone decarboxylase family protein YurZ
MTASQNNNLYIYEYLKTIEEKSLAADFVEQYLLPHLGKRLRPFAFLLVKNINHFIYEDGKLNTPYDGTENPSFVVGVRATAISMSAITEMDDSEKKDYSKVLIIDIMTNIISHQTTDTFNQFTSYGKNYYGIWMDEYPESEKDGMPLQNAKGFIAPHQGAWGEMWSVYPSLDEDVKAFINLAMNSSLEEVEVKYTDYSDIISKYKLMKKLINELGYIE